MENQGIKIGVFLVCFSLAMNLMGALGMGAQIGIEKSTQLGGEEITNSDEIANPGGVSSVEAVIGLAAAAVNTILTLGGAVDGVATALTVLDVRPEIAQMVQNGANLAFAIGLAAIIRGMRF